MKKIFNEKEMSFLRQYVGKELAERWERVEKKQNHTDVVTIANTGLYSSGKSSLFNALLDQIENERFPVGAIPTTKSGDKESLSADVEIIDTPGIDATYEDDQVAVNMLMESDIILVTHNIKMGMLNQSEYIWIQNIMKQVGENDLDKRLVFVCTWIDEVTDKSDRQKVTEELKRQLKEILGMEIPFWEVSSKRYCVAGKKKQEKLQMASNIPQFREWLLKKAEAYRDSTDDVRKAEIQLLCKDSRKILQEQIDDLQKELGKIQKEVDKQFAPRRETWNMILDDFRDRKAEIQKKVREIKKEGEEEYCESMFLKGFFEGIESLYK